MNLFEPSNIPPLPALSKEFYLSTMAPGMTNVTETAEMAVDIWRWAHQLVTSNLIPSYTADKHLVESVYRNQNGTYEHILLPTSNENTFVIIIIDLGLPSAKGYYVLNLQEEYS